MCCADLLLGHTYLWCLGEKSLYQFLLLGMCCACCCCCCLCCCFCFCCSFYLICFLNVQNTNSIKQIWSTAAVNFIHLVFCSVSGWTSSLSRKVGDSVGLILLYVPTGLIDTNPHGSTFLTCTLAAVGYISQVHVYFFSVWSYGLKSRVWNKKITVFFAKTNATFEVKMDKNRPILRRPTKMALLSYYLFTYRLFLLALHCTVYKPTTYLYN